ncbi:DEAD/DEAH box helicase [Benzoatithermus flavus]|uniref:DEAD/DEAH box helicase n=1 Tax=Benzoatithermus flavus TaxID=3108223 RepID=A0ABU8XPF9_9PROT
MDVFSLREMVVADYARFTRSFTKVAAPDIRAFLDQEYDRGRFWPAPLIQLNPSFVPGKSVAALVAEGVLHEECARIFRTGKNDGPGEDLRLHRHQEEAVRIAAAGRSYVLTTGTGSGKSLSYFIPIVDRVLRAKATDPKRAPSIAAIVVYPMNALCNSQLEELGKFLKLGYAPGAEPVTFARYTGQESQAEKDELARRPPDILLTNYMMLELILTRQNETDRAVVRAARGLRFLVLDELHTYRGRQGADVALLVRRVREALNENVLTVGTSATMVSEGEAVDRRRVVAGVASRLFGTTVLPEDIVTETLARVTPEEQDWDRAALAAAISEPLPVGIGYEALRVHPLAAWVETRLGLDREDGKWVRTRTPRSLEQAARMLAEESGCEPVRCEETLKAFLLLAHETRDEHGRSLFAFRLHQFVSGAGDLFGTLEPEGERYLTVDGQQFQPGTDRSKRLFNFCFCRECGQEYLPVWASLDGQGIGSIEPRELGDRAADDADQQHGFFMPDPAGKYALAPIEEAVPEEWLSLDGPVPRLKAHYKRSLPIPGRIDPLGRADEKGLPGWFIPGAFRFCLNCRTYHDAGVRSDLTKLGSLSTEGRSSATTVLTIAALRYLLDAGSGLPRQAQKLLGFTDNRQDASLQAGHFNDFVQIVLLRGALLAAIESDPDGALTDANLTQSVARQLRLQLAEYASNPQAKGLAAEKIGQALRDVLGYRLYHDLRRGWRITTPNLEQLGLLRLDYLGLEDLAGDAEAWREAPEPLALAGPETRCRLMRLVLDAMRRQLCIKTRYLDRLEQEQIRSRSHNLLKEPWGFSEDEEPEEAHLFVPVAEPPALRREFHGFFASSKSRLGRELGKAKHWGGPDSAAFPGALTEERYRKIVDHLLGAMAQYGIVESTELGALGRGWKVNADTLRWSLGDPEGDRPALGQRTIDNPFFCTLYRNVAAGLRADDRLLHRLEAREHTAQVDAETREEREDRFRAGELPVLFCSPTMELGVDIAQLNTVFMRNMPPTPANYAQRSGRAGRSGQPALVLTYAAAKSPHDQYFFRNPVGMVAGVVKPPALDLANEDLVSSHLHAVWLAETGQRLGSSVASVVEVDKPEELPVRDELRASMDLATVRERALRRGERILAMLADELTAQTAPWFAPDWLERTMKGAYERFDRALDRWRTLFKATRQQMIRAQEVMNSAATSPKERDEAKRRHDDAFIQQKLLLDTQAAMNADFYTYRYLASEGFLPGYNFPRLPLLAFVPARREKVGRDSFLSRPRFLGLAEFGPRSIIYHEGSQYRVYKAILSVRDEETVSVDARLPTHACRMCPSCGYGHFRAEADAERCTACGTPLEGGLLLKELYRIDNVATRRVMRITSDEEERQRQGYETLTTLQFATKNGTLQVVRTDFADAEGPLLELQYGPAATVWRVNLGWRRRKEGSNQGFKIDVITGRWLKDTQAPSGAGDDGDGPGKAIPQWITPFVEDRRNVLLAFPKASLTKEQMATLQHALKRGIEREFQIEESELIAEPLPKTERRNAILFYEAAEGGAGVLTRLALDHAALRRVAARALEVCHFERSGESWHPDTLRDTDRKCEAGCYRCLLSYYNQTEHELINRRDAAVLRLLCRLTQAEGRAGTEGRSPDEHLAELMRLCGSSLERAWLQAVRDLSLRLPDRAQRLLPEHGTRPDFEYAAAQAVVYVDGPHHAHDAQKRLDAAITERLEDAGLTVIRFGPDQGTWRAVFESYPDIFGKVERR